MDVKLYIEKLGSGRKKELETKGYIGKFPLQNHQLLTNESNNDRFSKFYSEFITINVP